MNAWLLVRCLALCCVGVGLQDGLPAPLLPSLQRRTARQMRRQPCRGGRCGLALSSLPSSHRPSHADTINPFHSTFPTPELSNTSCLFIPFACSQPSLLRCCLRWLPRTGTRGRGCGRPSRPPRTRRVWCVFAASAAAAVAVLACVD